MQLIMTILAIIAVVSPLLSLISKVSAAISLVASPVGLVILAILALVAAGVLLYKNWDTIKEKAVNLWNGLKSTFENIKTTISNVVQSVISKVQSLWEKISTTFNNIKDKIKNVIDTIKGIFNTTISFPHIKLPHFNVSGGQVPWGLGGKGTPPSISIDWYRKAYQNPVMFTSPTVLPTSAGLKGFGDGSGAEIVMGLDKLRQLVGANQGQPNVQIGKVEITVNGAGKNAEEIGRDLWIQLARKGVIPA